MKSYRKYFKAAIESNYPGCSGDLLNQIETKFDILKEDVRFAGTSRNLVDRRLAFTAYFLAFIAVLEKQDESYEAIRKVSLDIVLEYVRPKNRIQKFIKTLPVLLLRTRLGSVLIKALEKKVQDAVHPDGFVVKMITDKKETYGLGYGIDIMECGICKLFNKHGYSQYARILCEADEITSGLAGLKLIRAGTIANGASKCDFRWKVK
jgi:L-2-amino-thiazoline-4-carboxylic acid hydrolase